MPDVTRPEGKYNMLAHMPSELLLLESWPKLLIGHVRRLEPIT